LFFGPRELCVPLRVANRSLRSLTVAAGKWTRASLFPQRHRIFTTMVKNVHPPKKDVSLRRS
jgi:hypothetical protein